VTTRQFAAGVLLEMTLAAERESLIRALEELVHQAIDMRCPHNICTEANCAVLRASKVLERISRERKR
jgi:hypothetical protein